MVQASHIPIAIVFGAGIVSAVAGALAYLRTRERRDHAGVAFVALTAGTALWTMLLGAQLLAGQTPLAHALLRAKWVASVPVVTTGLLFALYYTGRGDWVTPRRTLLLSVEPVVETALIVLNPGNLFFTEIVEGTAFGLPVLTSQPGVAFLVHLGYNYVGSAVFVVLLAEAATRSSGPYRNQALALTLSALLPLVSSVVYFADPPWAPPLDVTPVMFGVSSVVLLVAMYRYDLFDVAPVAHETVFATLDDAIVVVDESDRVLETNPAAREAFGFSGDGVGCGVADVLPDVDQIDALLAGDDAEVALADGGESAVASNGSPPRYFEATCEQLGREGVRLLVFRDVTEQTRVERRYRSYVEHADDIIAVADADGVFEYISPAVESVLGRTPEAMTGNVMTDHIHPDDRRTVAKSFAQSLGRPGETVRVRFRMEHRDGGWRTLDGVGVNRFHDPHIGGYLLTLRDETHRDRYEQRLRVLTRVLRHDLRNELNVVLGYADTIAAADDGQTRAYAERIHRSAERLSSLGERVRDVDQTLQNAEHGGRPVDVAGVVENVAVSAHERFPDATVTTDVVETYAYADELLATALWNVVENAVRHHDGSAPSVSMTADTDGDTIEIRIADDGPGIPDEARTVVESGHETQLQHASGIGLWLVRWILEGVDGELSFVERPTPADVDDDSLDGDVGTVVVLRLRAAEGDYEGSAVSAQVAPWRVATATAEQTDGGGPDWRTSEPVDDPSEKQREDG